MPNHPSKRTLAQKIALIQAHLEGEAADFTLPYTLAVISAWLKKLRPEAEVFLANTVEEALIADEVWCTSLSEAWGKAIEIGHRVTQEQKKFIVGGHQATALPHTMPYGTVYKGPLESYTHLDELPLPDWSIFPDPLAYAPVLMTSRGCPFSCNFCSSRAFWQGYQEKSAERVVLEVRQLAKMGAKKIIIFDDLFAANKRRLEKIIEMVYAEGLQYIEYNCLVRSDSVTNYTLDLLKKLNVSNMAFGAESGDNNILKSMNKKNTVARNMHALKLLNAYGYKPNTGFILGYPGENKETLKRTCDTIQQMRPLTSIIDVYPVIAYPGTPLWKIFVDKFKPDFHHFDWSSLALRSDAVDWSKYYLLTDTCTKDDLHAVAEWNKKAKSHPHTPPREDRKM